MADPATVTVIRVPYPSVGSVEIYPGEISRERTDGMLYRYTIEGLAE